MTVDTISIIVPIYNVERYLERCLDSILSQTYTHLEVLLINDGSKDRSLEICEMYAKRDLRVKVINKVNEGVSVARNTGLEVATGKYIGFVDPDDWIESNMYEKLYECIRKTDYPICLCNYYKDTKKRSSKKTFHFKEDSLSAEAVKDYIVTNMIGLEDLMPKYTYIMGCVWRGLYERAFIEAHELRFTKGITIMEDLVFMVQCLLKSNGVCIDHGARYHYVQNPKSTLHTYNQKMWEDQIKVHELLEKSLMEAALEEEMRNRMDLRYISMVLSAIKNEVYINGNNDLKNRVSHIKQICTDDKLRIVLERVKPIQKSMLKDENKVKAKKKKDKMRDKVKVTRNTKVKLTTKETKKNSLKANKRVKRKSDREKV